MRLLIAPKLKIVSMYDPTHSNPSIILPPHQEHFPSLVEPMALGYVCRGPSRIWDFTYTSGHLTISESPDLRLFGDRPTNRWLPPDTPISFRGMKELVVGGSDGYPLPGSIPVEPFESLESQTGGRNG